MLYRTKLDNENMDIQDPQNMTNVNDTIPGPQQSPFMGYPMMNEMYDPSSYGYQIPQQQYQIPELNNENMDRAKNHNSYEDGYNHGYKHGYGHGYNHGYNHGHKGYGHGYDYNYNYGNNSNPFLPLLPFLFFRD